MIKAIFLSLVIVACSGCASIVNDTTHPMKIETKNADGQLVAGADCKVGNDYGTISMKSGSSALVRRSARDLDITCTHPANPEAIARAISRANAGMFGNIILGGGIGAIIDHNKGTAYTYPTWVQLVFGKTLVFDRNAEKEGQPTLAMGQIEGSPATPGAPAASPATVSTVSQPQKSETANTESLDSLKDLIPPK